MTYKFNKLVLDRFNISGDKRGFRNYQYLPFLYSLLK